MQAVAFVEQAFELDPSNPGAVNSAINGSFNLGKYEAAISFYHRSDLRRFEKSSRQNIHNRAAMAFNMLEQHDSAFATVQKAIAVEPIMGYPYSTLAETFAFTGQFDSCWHYLEKAFKLGFEVENIDPDDPPYSRLVSMQEYQALIAEYGDPEEELAD